MVMKDTGGRNHNSPTNGMIHGRKNGDFRRTGPLLYHSFDYLAILDMNMSCDGWISLQRHDVNVRRAHGSVFV